MASLAKKESERSSRRLNYKPLFGKISPRCSVDREDLQEPDPREKRTTGERVNKAQEVAVFTALLLPRESELRLNRVKRVTKLNRGETGMREI